MKYDYVIVGAGSAGCVLACRLSEDPHCSVLLLEAGPDYPDPSLMPDELKYASSGAAAKPGAVHNWSFLALPAQQQTSLKPLARGRVTGGTSAINYHIFLRPVPEDFELWAERGNHRWSFREVLPYFCKSETDEDFAGDCHGKTGPIPVRRYPPDSWGPLQKAFYDAAIAVGFPDDVDMNHPQSTGVGAMPLNLPGRVRMSTALTYLNASRHRNNLTIKPDAHARRILFRGKRAYGVEAESSGELVVIEGNEIIVSAGSIASPQLLMLSGVGPIAHLAAFGIAPVRDLPGVGQNMKNHPNVSVRFQPKPGFVLPADAPRNQVGLRFTAAGSNMRNDIQIQPLNPYPDSTDERDIGLGVRLEYSVGTGELRLASTDPKVQPVIEYRFLSEPRDRLRLRAAVRVCCNLLERAPLSDLVERRVTPGNDVLASDDALDLWMQQAATMAGHTVSTCRMGMASDPMAVVDQYCRVHGLDGLRIVDASIMPDIPRANTNATTIMIGERAADLIKQADTAAAKCPS